MKYFFESILNNTVRVYGELKSAEKLGACFEMTMQSFIILATDEHSLEDDLRLGCNTGLMTKTLAWALGRE